MSTKTHSHKFELRNGGQLYVNRIGAGWTVDMFDYGWEEGTDPTYHAWYGTEAEALEDAELWQR